MFIFRAWQQCKNSRRRIYDKLLRHYGSSFFAFNFNALVKLTFWLQMIFRRTAGERHLQHTWTSSLNENMRSIFARLFLRKQSAVLLDGRPWRKRLIWGEFFFSSLLTKMISEANCCLRSRWNGKEVDNKGQCDSVRTNERLMGVTCHLPGRFKSLPSPPPPK